MSMWGGRFTEPMSDVTRSFTGDTSDHRLLKFDIQGSIAHVTMMGATGIIPLEEAETLASGLQEIAAEEFEFLESDEDVHSAVERRLNEVVGDVAGKLHTGRSRNDQVATDLRLFIISESSKLINVLRLWVEKLTDLAAPTSDVPMPTYTHLQQAQKTSLGNHLLAYAWMAKRDVERVEACRHRLSASPLGAGASAGSSLPIDRVQTAVALDLGRPIPNTLDAVASRDFVAEYVFCCAQTMTHMSRIAEELIIWCSSEFGGVVLGDTVSTGSSALPHKRNPDIAELVRGRAAGVSGDVVSTLALQKALPLAYNRDLQEDKRLIFHAHDVTLSSVEAMTHLLDNVEFRMKPPRPETLALPLAEKLVMRGVPFREAHAAVGELVLRLEAERRTLEDVSGHELVEHDSRFREDDTPVEVPLPDLSDQIGELRVWLGGG